MFIEIHIAFKSKFVDQMVNNCINIRQAFVIKSKYDDLLAIYC